MTTTLGFVHLDRFDDQLGQGGTQELLTVVARYAPERRVRVWHEGGYVEVHADGSSHPKVFGEDEEPEGEMEPTVRRVGFIGWPSDSAPQLPELIVPGWDGTWDLRALRSEPLLAQVLPPECLGCTDDALAWVDAPVFEADDVPHRRPQALEARYLLATAACLDLLMIYR